MKALGTIAIFAIIIIAFVMIMNPLSDKYETGELLPGDRSHYERIVQRFASAVSGL